MSDHSKRIDVDTSEVEELVKSLTSKDLRRAVGTATRRATSPILSQTKSNFRSLVSGAADGRSGQLGGLRLNQVRKRKGSYSMVVRNLPVVVSKMFWQRTQNPYTTVTIRTRNNNTDFRALFFERGTKLRRTGKGYNRGSIQQGRYFSRAVEQREQQVVNSMKEEILAALEKKIQK